MIIVLCLTTKNTKLIILLIFTNETLVVFPLDTRYRNVIMIYRSYSATSRSRLRISRDPRLSEDLCKNRSAYS